MSIHILTSLHQKSNHGPSHMNHLLAIHQDIQYVGSFYKKKLMSIELNSNTVVRIFIFCKAAQTA